MEQHELNVFSSCLISIGTCLIHSIVYIASLYVWNYQHGRNHPDSILKRFLSVFIMLFISPTFLYLALNKETLEKKTLLSIIGLRTEGLIQAFIMPLFLTMILFLGPLSMQLCNGLLKLYAEPMHWANNAKDLIWLRNHIVAPLSEEFSFRSCMLPLLLQCFEPITAVIICPIFFGAAHFHHIFEYVRNGMPLKHAVLGSCFHFTYTTVFGMYSAYLFYRTGHFASTFIVHAFCNHMGVPDFQELFHFKGRQRLIVGCAFILGLVLWGILLNPLTEPKWYYNNIFHTLT